MWLTVTAKIRKGIVINWWWFSIILNSSLGHIKPHFDNRCKVFELDPCDGYGKVCLVYKDIKAGVTTGQPEIWFLDRSLEWCYLASSFTDYFRMMIVHLGLPLWQYLFTATGLSPETKQWFNLYAPTRLAIDIANAEPKAQQKPDSTERNQSAVNLPLNSLDISRLFKGKTDKGRSKLSQAKKPPLGKTQNSSQGRQGQSGRSAPRWWPHFDNSCLALFLHHEMWSP